MNRVLFETKKKNSALFMMEKLETTISTFESVARKIGSDIGEQIIILVINSCQKHNVRFAYLLNVGLV